jgi:pimeloyl-ACP methyl ester carboxylesterase
MIKTIAVLVVLMSLVARAQAAPLPPGSYNSSGHTIYVGVENELPESPHNDFFDPTSQHTGDLQSPRGLQLRSGISEERHVLDTAQGRLGFSLYYASGEPRPTVILIHGNDPEAREMGFIIPFFVCNGINVISYDQRGVGESKGNWFLNGPIQKADDVDAIYDALRNDRHIDSHRIGLWGFSNGGWTAPLVSLRRPMAFMILQSSPTESLLSNIDYEVEQQMLRHAVGAYIPKALAVWHVVEKAIHGEVSWAVARQAYDSAAQQSWFKYSLMPQLGLSLPPPPSVVAGLRRAINFDPTNVLLHVTVPTLALYGTLDRNVDAADSATHLREYLTRAGDRDFKIETYTHVGHLLEISKTGYNGDQEPPERFAPGYPAIMITWLSQRGLTKGQQR